MRTPRRPPRGRVAAIATTLLIAMPLWTASTALAAGPIDQAQDAAPTGSLGLFDTPAVGRTVAQTFTAGVSGTLDQVDLQLGRVGDPGPLTVQVRAVSGGAVQPTVLASATVPSSSISADTDACPLGCWVSVPLPGTASAAGTAYAIVASVGPTSGADEVVWGFGGDYAGGDGQISADGGASFDAAGVDLGFRTHVTPAATPPPPPPPPPPPSGAGGDCGHQQWRHWWRPSGCHVHHWHWRDHAWHDDD